MATWFAYEFCTDVAATRKFYGELVGLPMIWDGADGVAFTHECVQVLFTRVDSLERPDGWAFQPGWSHGQLPDAPRTQLVPSISMALPAAGFEAATRRLQEVGVEALRPEPFWVGYWSFVVLDPDGRTVELTDPVSPESR